MATLKNIGAMMILAAMIAAAILGFSSPAFTGAEFAPPPHEHEHDGYAIGSRVGVDCTPVGCLSGSTMGYSYRDSHGKAVYTSRGCDKAPDQDAMGTGIKTHNGVWHYKRDPDGAYGTCAFISVHVGHEPDGHRGVIWNNGRHNGIDVYGKFSCHRRRC